MVRLLWDDVGVGRCPCTEPAHDARSRFVRCKACAAGVSEMELGAKSSALAANEGGMRVMGNWGAGWVTFCGIISPKAASRGGSAATAAAGVLTGAGSRTVPMDATDIDSATLESALMG